MVREERIEVGTPVKRIRKKGVRLDKQRRKRIIDCTHRLFEGKFNRFRKHIYDSPGVAPWYPRGEDNPSIPVTCHIHFKK